MSISPTAAHPAGTESRTPEPETTEHPKATQHPERLEGLKGPERVGRAAYRREPYVRITLDAASPILDAGPILDASPIVDAPGPIVDAKAVAWTSDTVLIHWVDDELAAHNVWVRAPRVQRIKRSESRWQDPYDDFAFYLEHGQLDVG